MKRRGHTRPPDCEATLDGRVSGVEVTELIDQQSLKRNLRDLESPEYFNWAALQKRIDAKDREWKGERYERRVLVIENELNRDIVSRFLEVARFRATRITDAFLGLSYHSSAEPEGGCYPVFHLDLHHAGQT